MQGDLSDTIFRLAVRVDPSGVEVADALVQRFIQDFDGLFLAAVVLVDDTLGSEAQDGQFCPGAAEWSSLHFCPSSFIFPGDYSG
jgi:hypothetical protein